MKNLRKLKTVAIVLTLAMMCMPLFQVQAMAVEDASQGDETPVSSITENEKAIVSELDSSAASITTGTATEYYESLQDAIDNASAGDTIMLLKDIQLNGQSNGFININKSVTIDGGNFTISGFGYRGSNPATIEINQLNPTNNIDVTIKNLTIDNTAVNARPIETRADDYSYAMVNSLTLDNVSISAVGGGSTQGITIGNWHDATLKLNIKDSSIASSYIDIMVWNPTDITIDNSEMSGYGCLYFGPENSSAGSYKSSLTVKNGSMLTSTNDCDGEDNNFSTIAGSGQLTVKIIDSSVIAKAEGTAIQYAIRIDNYEDWNYNPSSSISVEGNSKLEAAGSNTAIVYFADYSLGSPHSCDWDIQFKSGKYTGPLYGSGNEGTGEKLGLANFKITGGIYTDEAAIYDAGTSNFGISGNVPEEMAVIANPDKSTSETYPWTIGHIVKFDSKGGTPVNNQEVLTGARITEPENPTISGSKSFAGWFKPDGSQFLFDKDVISANTTLTAHWLDSSTSKGDVVVEKKKTSTIESTANIGTDAIPLTSNEIDEINESSDNEIKVTLDVEKVDTPQGETADQDAELIQQLIEDKGLIHGTYLDISLVKAIYENGIMQGEETAIHETLKPVTITVVVPENLRENGRIYSVVRCHEGKAEILFTGKANSKWEITFQTDRFSTYEIAYDNSEVTPGGSTEDEDGIVDGTESGSAETGDSSPLMLCLGLLILSILVFAGTLLARGRRQNN